MTIAAILRQKGSAVTTVPVDAPLSVAVGLLHDHRIGAVLAVSGGSIEGVVSERDVIRALHTGGASVLDRACREIMSAPVVTVSPADLAEGALAIMTERRFRHLPVVEDGQLVGIVSIGDLVKRRIDEAMREAEMLKEYITTG